MTVSTLTAQQKLDMVSGYDRVQRYLSYVEIVPIFEATVTAINQDSDYDGIHSLEFGTPDLGAYTDIKPGMLVYVGSEYESNDVGEFFVRKNATTDTLYVNWTSHHLINVTIGDHITVLDDYRPWLKLIRRVDTSGGLGISFTEYHNYDETYSNQNYYLDPIVNVTDYAVSRGVIHAGFVDDYGTADEKTYREMELTVAASTFPGVTGAGSAVYSWDIVDGTITVGDIDEVAITVRFPAGFRWISVTVTDSHGEFATRRIPIWVHDSNYLPITNFKVILDETKNFRNIELELYGNSSDFDTSILRRFCTMCYWERATYGRIPVTTADQYRIELQGWTIQEESELQFGEGKLRLSLTDIGGCLSEFRGFGQILYDPITTPTAWYQIYNMTHAKAVLWILENCAYALPLMNYTFDTQAYSMKEIELSEGSLWDQIIEVLKRIYASPFVDTWGSIHAVQFYSYLTGAIRLTKPPIVWLNESHWQYDTPPVITWRHSDKMAILQATGSAYDHTYDADHLIVRASQAPTRVFGRGLNAETAPYQDLPATDSQVELNRITGHHYARLNNSVETIDVKLIYNMDVIEMAFGQPVALSYEKNDVRGLVFHNQYCLVTRIATKHNYEEKLPPKEITLTLELATFGLPAATVPIVGQPTPEPDCDPRIYPDFSAAIDGLDVDFTNASTAEDTIVAYFWDFGDGTYSTATNPSHTYPDTGTYWVTLYVASDCGSIDYIQGAVSVVNPCDIEVVISDFTYVATGLSVAFTDTSTADEGVDSWLWDFGDGDTSTSQNPTHEYVSADTYTVTLTVTSTCGNINSSSQSVEVVDTPPSAWLSTSTKIAIFRNDSSVSIGTVGSGLTNHALGTTRIRQFVPDFTSDLLTGAGTQVDGWFIGGNASTYPPKLYRIEDIDGARTVTELYDVQSDTGQADAGLYAMASMPGHYPVVIGRYVINLSSPTRIITVLFTLTTTDGVNFTRNDFTPTSTPGTGSYILGGVAASVAIDYVTGYIYVGYGVGTTILSGSVTPTTIANGIHESTDGGVTFNSTPNYATGGLGIPAAIIANDGDLWYSDPGTAEYLKNGVEVHLVEDSVDHTPFIDFIGNGSVSINISDPTKMAAACKNHASSDRQNFISTDGGANWSVVAASGDYPTGNQFLISLVMGDDPTKVLWLGSKPSGTIQNIYIKTTGTTGDDSGNLETAAALSSVIGAVRLD